MSQEQNPSNIESFISSPTFYPCPNPFNLNLRWRNESFQSTWNKHPHPYGKGDTIFDETPNTKVEVNNTTNDPTKNLILPRPQSTKIDEAEALEDWIREKYRFEKTYAK